MQRTKGCVTIAKTNVRCGACISAKKSAMTSCRNEGIGRALFLFAEQAVGEAGIEFIMLSTATKNYKRILHFYIDELGMDFWSARLFKKL